MKVYGYARVSTQEQAVEYDALKQQIKRLEDAGAEIVLFDIESGRSDSRKSFNEILKLVEKGKVRELIITRVDRLGRSMITMGQTLKLFEDHKVTLRILDAPVDASSPFGWFSISQMSGLAEFESRLLSQRTRHGMNYFREQKRIHKALFGYNLVDSKLVVDENLRNVCRELIDKLVAGYSVVAASRWLFEEHNIKFSVSGLRHWINSPHILGHTRYFTEQEHRRNKNNPRPPIIHNNTHEAIATEEEILKIKQKIQGQQKVSVNKSKNYPLKGQIRCAECGGAMHRQSNKWTTYVRCTKHTQGNHFCSNKKINRLESVVRWTINALIKEAAKIVDELDVTSTEESEPETLKKLRNELTGLLALNSSNPAVISAIQDIENQIYNHEYKLKTHPKKADIEHKVLIHSASQAAFWDEFNEEELQHFLSELVDKVYIDSFGDLSVTFLW
jgi:site-specific DNA recombinase